MPKPLHYCPACKGVLSRRHYATCPKVDRERKRRDAKALRSALQRLWKAGS